ncbi:protochlorophyllide-dependent translocon component 52, chloroplastic-like [Setaria italica]|uniref:protochlorophyllide-dependent translocon component 52, chloroplastic-like n=1 Tax=Setaria italica TaxID=4555 RepID=UPI000BE4FD0D|nr:protochlorophyllide-dependent translocon component 52, chloroplastic-like [Setaria italica]
MHTKRNSGRPRPVSLIISRALSIAIHPKPLPIISQRDTRRPEAYVQLPVAACLALLADPSLPLLPPLLNDKPGSSLAARAMDPLALLALPRAARPFAATVAPPSRSTRRGAARLVPSDHRCRGGACRRASASAVAPEAPRADEAPAPAEERFEWLDQWYPFAPVGELDPGAPHGKTVLGLSVVAWYDRAAGEWRVFDDACPHRLAPLSEGRIDGKGRLLLMSHTHTGGCYPPSPMRKIPEELSTIEKVAMQSR